MGGHWLLNGVELTAAQVSVRPTRLLVGQQFRQVKVNLHGGSQHRERVGLDLASLSIDISFLGRGTAKLEQAAYVKEVLETDDVWTLTAPSDLPVYAYKDFKRVPCSTDSWRFDNLKATGRVTLAIEATINGVWVADGGTYCEPIAGNFTLQSDGTYLRDDGVNTGSTPKVRLPEQVFGYPLALNSVYQMSQPANSGSVVVDDQTFQDFVMTGFLHPAPTATGDVGLYEVCSAPSSAFLDVGAGTVEDAAPLEGSVAFNETTYNLDVILKDNSVAAIEALNPATEGLNITNT